MSAQSENAPEWSESEIARLIRAFALDQRVNLAGPETARDAVRNEAARPIDLEETWRRCEAVIEGARALRQATSDLAAETHRMVAKHRKLTADDAGFLQHYVEGLARMLRECGAPPERALVLVKREVQPLIAAAAPDGVLVLTERVVRWFVDGYYAA